MAKTKNRYYYPINADKIIRITYDESPAHKGPLKESVDFVVPVGTPVKAARRGKVVDILDGSEIGGEDRKFEEFGNFVEIEHDNEEYSEYEHLRKGLLVKVGDMVKRGQMIGYSGDTGWIAQLGPHLHFMVGKYGKTIKDYKTLEIVWRKSGNL